MLWRLLLPCMILFLILLLLFVLLSQAEGGIFARMDAFPLGCLLMFVGVCLFLAHGVSRIVYGVLQLYSCDNRLKLQFFVVCVISQTVTTARDNTTINSF